MGGSEAEATGFEALRLAGRRPGTEMDYSFSSRGPAPNAGSPASASLRPGPASAAQPRWACEWPQRGRTPSGRAVRRPTAPNLNGMAAWASPLYEPTPFVGSTSAGS